MPGFDVALGRRLAQALDEANMLKKEFAHKMGVPAQTVSRWLSGQAPMEAAEVRKAACVLRTTTLWLMGEEPASDEAALVRLIRPLSPERREEARRFVAYLLDQERREGTGVRGGAGVGR
ncbi:MAG TPA: helix-turn-helix transcriptional regulator [Chloroflexota bacterium]|jgi:transcriptional regulator with XRE-family HTH domain|nr:helix-turn-helix transcriptional regulator [Chloroflexota bacterium]